MADARSCLTRVIFQFCQEGTCCFFKVHFLTFVEDNHAEDEEVADAPDHDQDDVGKDQAVVGHRWHGHVVLIALVQLVVDVVALVEEAAVVPAVLVAVAVVVRGREVGLGRDVDRADLALHVGVNELQNTIDVTFLSFSSFL